MRLIPERAQATPPYCYWDGAFSPEELDTLMRMAASAGQSATVGDGDVVDSIRRSTVSWLPDDDQYGWVYARLTDVVSRINAENYRFDLTGWGEQIQLANYDSEQKGCYEWHQDFGSDRASRKMSLVMQLTGPENYEGGNLEIMTSCNPVRVEKRRGLIALFPSYTLHRVTPVTEGSRQSLVAWITGPAFK